MGSHSSVLTAFCDQGHVDSVDVASSYASVKLTPALVLTISLMFMIASDGHVDDTESSQIQSVIGRNEALVQFASTYVRHVPLPMFLSLASQGLSQRDKTCILSNVCDAMLADGLLQRIEQQTFDLLLAAFGVSKQEFAFYQDTLAFKNDKKVLGSFSLAMSQTSMTPHLALAAAVLYIMSADGSIDQHEIGRLEMLVAEFDGLQKLAVAYVKKNKRERFIQEVAYALNEAQKNFILLNVYDTMSADGVIAVTEDKIFQALLSKFGIAEAALSKRLQVLEDKNIKPFDIGKADVAHVFDVAFLDEKLPSSLHDSLTSSTLGLELKRTMQSNVAQVNNDMGATSHVIQIQSNAMGEANLQRVDAANDAPHREQLSGDVFAPNVVQLADKARALANKQPIQVEAIAHRVKHILLEDTPSNQQMLSPQALVTHREGLGQEASKLNKQRVDAEVRIDNLWQDIESLHQQLTAFEAKNKSWLNIGQVFRRDEASNQQRIDASYTRAEAALGSGLAHDQGDAIPTAVDLETVVPEQVPSHMEEELGLTSTVKASQGTDARKATLFDEGSARAMLMPPVRFGWRECTVALMLSFCVSNMGVAKSGKSTEVRGMLNRLAVPVHIEEVPDIVRSGP